MYNINRLNLTQMVNKNILGHQENKFFNATQINTEDFYEQERYTRKIKQAQERHNLAGKINNIVFHVHEKLRERQSSPNKLKAKPVKNKSKEKIIEEKQLVSLQTIENLINSTDNIECKNMSIPRIKALCNDKQQKRVHKSTKTSNCNNYENQKRLAGVLQRQNELQNLLEEQKLIKQGRHSIAQDIFAMRHCLDDIQHRVNNSLKQLDNKKTYCECHGLITAKSCKKCFEKETKHD
ncbi:uncharacterized protein LOC135952281 [Calliphora vicina]|uniref:uncharacterized protein LOC135952281 n=1 Tax=Calliphora vicina TaxID=7373 RepID=UPI00325A4637